MGMNPIFPGDGVTAYRDPAAVCCGNRLILFFTVSVKKDGYMYNRVGMSETEDLRHWSPVKLITEENLYTNYCSPGCVVKDGEEYVLCITSYPMPFPFAERSWADDTARLYTMRTRDFVTFSAPELIRAKGDNVRPEDMGRMIDPFLIKDGSGTWQLFYKQNGVSRSHSDDLKHWSYDGRTDGGENACVIEENGEYILFHSPANGIGMKRSKDLVNWTDCGVTTLFQDEWDWADGRLTAGFVMRAPDRVGHRYLMFFHGSRKSETPETHGGASLGMVVSDDLMHWEEPLL